MRKRRQITLIGSLTAISFLSTMFSTVPARAQAGVDIIMMTGRKPRAVTRLTTLSSCAR